MGQTVAVTDHRWGLVSVGYEGRTSGDLLEMLDTLGVSTLVDVRLTPLSRKPGLSKTRLAAAANALGMTHSHLPALGNPRDNRDVFRDGQPALGCIRFSKLLARPDSAAAMDQLEAYARDGLAAVLCFEREHERCHRQVIVDELQLRLGAQATLIHA